MAQEPSPPPNGQEHKWRQKSTEPGAGQAVPKKRRRLFITLLFFLAVVGAIIAFVFLYQPLPPAAFVTFSITQYTDPRFPPNPWAKQDSDALSRYFKAEHTTQAFASQEYERLRKELANLRNRPESTLVVQVSCLALSDGQEVYLLPANGDPDNLDLRLPFRDVLKDLGNSHAKHKLLFLDLMQPIADPRLGTLLNDVPERVKALVEAEKDPNLLVLCACSPGQVSLASEELGQSVFGFYLVEGLRGHAQGYNRDHKISGRLKMLELTTFVTARVDRWAGENRHVRQTPLLLGKGDDFDLIVPLESGPGPESGTDRYSPALAEGWALRDKWRGQESKNQFIPPVLMRELETTLLRHEHHLRGGSSVEEIEKEMGPKVKSSFPNRLTRDRNALPLFLAAESLTRSGKAPDADLADRLRIQLIQLEPTAPPAKPADPKSAPAKEDGFAKIKDKLLGEKPPSPEVLASTIFKVAVEDSDLTPVRLRFLSQLLASAKNVPATVETMYLRRLTEPQNPLLKLNESAEENKPVFAAMRASLRVVQKGETILGMDPRVFPWVQTQLSNAADERRQAENLLLKVTFSTTFTQRDLEKKWERIESAYQGLLNDCETLQTAHEACDHALALLPGFVPFLANQDQPEESQADKDWGTAVKALTALAKLLELSSEAAPAAGDRERIAQIPDPTDNLRNALAALKKHLKKADDIATMDDLLATTWLSAAERKNLWSQRRALAQERCQATRDKDEKENGSHRQTPAPSPWDEQTYQDRELKRGLRRAKLALGLLELGGWVGVKTLSKELAAQTQPTAESLHAFGQRLRQVWAKELPDQLAQHYRQGLRQAADRLSRIQYPSDRTPWNRDKPDQDPAVLLRKQEMRVFYQWLANQYRLESKNAAEWGYYQEFYESAATNLH